MNSVTKESDQLEMEKLFPFKLRIIRIIFYIVYKGANLFYLPLIIYRLFQRPKKVSRVTDDVLRIPANELARKIRKKEISCEKVIRSYIARIEEVNPLINAVVDQRFSDAIEDAKKVDLLVSSEDFLSNESSYAEKYPLLGVPVTIKASLALKGLAFHAGSVERKDVKADEDAAIVKLAREAGAIPLLVSNVPEFCLNWETINNLTGITRNPHDTNRVCGGSSGGEASLLASGASLLGTGSDLSGSVRIPAGLCGVFGHKPTARITSVEGHFPTGPDKEKWESVFTTGPMTRYAGDLKPFLRVIARPDMRSMLQLDKKIDVKKIRIHYWEMDSFWYPTRSCCNKAVRKAVDHLKNIVETPPQEVDFPLLKYAPEMSILKLGSLIEGVKLNSDDSFGWLMKEILRYLTGFSDHCFMFLCLAVSHSIFKASFSETQRKNVNIYISMLRENFENTLGKDGVLIMPTFPRDAFHHHDAFKIAMSTGILGLFNVLGYPATSCPIGRSPEGLPLGVQVVGLQYSDNLTIAVAEEIEKAFGGWIEP